MGDEAAIESLAGTMLDGRFVLERFVARGGYGAVYRSTHPALGCPVAIKVLIGRDGDEDTAGERFAEAFEREARMVAALHHAAIVRVYDAGVTIVEGRAHSFIVLEWIDGVTLESALRDPAPRRRSPRDALDLLKPVFDAIGSAHEAGIVHRDLKPRNIMVTTPRRGESSIRVLDFGVAKALDPGESAPDWSERTGDAFSSFSITYAAPEQVGRLRTGPWTDVHALALLLVEVIVGERAYRGESSIDLFASISAPRRPTPATFSVNVGAWEDVLARALSLAPAGRQANASELLGELEATADDAQRAWEASTRCAHAAVEEPSVRDASRRWGWRPLALGVACLAALGAMLWHRPASSSSSPARVEPPHVAHSPSPAVPQSLPPSLVAPPLPLAPPSPLAAGPAEAPAPLGRVAPPRRATRAPLPTRSVVAVREIAIE